VPKIYLLKKLKSNAKLASMKHLLYCSALLTLLFFIASCKDRVIEPSAQTGNQLAYYPLNIGKYTTYIVDSVLFDPDQGFTFDRDSSRTYVKEIITDTLRNNLNELEYKIERYESKSLADPFEIKNVWTAALNGTQAIRTENNMRFLKFIFPMDKRSEWNGNIFIDINREIEFQGERLRPFTNWQYEVDSIDVAGIIGNFAFDSLLIVSEANENNIIERRYSRAKYAKNIGLVYKEQFILDSQYCNQSPVPGDCNTKSWEEKGEKGYILRQWLIDHN
jgi:hypothetical protein